MHDEGHSMKRGWLSILLISTACGDDGAASDGADTTGTGDGTASETAASLSAGVSSNSAGTTSTGEEESTSSGEASSSGTTQVPGTESSGGASTSTGAAESCLPDEIFDAIDQHAHDLVATAALLATHPSEAEVTSFLLAPGLPDPPALAAQFAGPLIMTCSDPLLYDEFCEMGRCSQIECTGEGSSWISHVWLEPAIVDEPWSFEEVHIHLHWSGGTGTTFDIETMATAPGGEDVSLVGTGVMDLDSMSVTETFAALHPAGDTVLEYADDAGGYSGQLTIADVVVAEVDAAGHLEPTGDCP
jgi:hypothetical protein